MHNSKSPHGQKSQKQSLSPPPAKGSQAQQYQRAHTQFNIIEMLSKKEKREKMQLNCNVNGFKSLKDSARQSASQIISHRNISKSKSKSKSREKTHSLSPKHQSDIIENYNISQQQKHNQNQLNKLKQQEQQEINNIKEIRESVLQMIERQNNQKTSNVRRSNKKVISTNQLQFLHQNSHHKNKYDLASKYRLNKTQNKLSPKIHNYTSNKDSQETLKLQNYQYYQQSSNQSQICDQTTKYKVFFQPQIYFRKKSHGQLRNESLSPHQKTQQWQNQSHHININSPDESLKQSERQFKSFFNFVCKKNYNKTRPQDLNIENINNSTQQQQAQQTQKLQQQQVSAPNIKASPLFSSKSAQTTQKSQKFFLSKNFQSQQQQQQQQSHRMKQMSKLILEKQHKKTKKQQQFEQKKQQSPSLPKDKSSKSKFNQIMKKVLGSPTYQHQQQQQLSAKNNQTIGYIQMNQSQPNIMVTQSQNLNQTLGLQQNKNENIQKKKKKLKIQQQSALNLESSSKNQQFTSIKSPKQKKQSPSYSTSQKKLLKQQPQSLANITEVISHNRKQNQQQQQSSSKEQKDKKSDFLKKIKQSQQFQKKLIHSAKKKQEKQEKSTVRCAIKLTETQQQLLQKQMKKHSSLSEIGGVGKSTTSISNKQSQLSQFGKVAASSTSQELVIENIEGENEEEEEKEKENEDIFEVDNDQNQDQDQEKQVVSDKFYTVFRRMQNILLYHQKKESDIIQENVELKGQVQILSQQLQSVKHALNLE